MLKAATFLAFAFTASPAFAAGSAQVPEGSAATLLALGLAGVLIGRRGAMRPRRRDDEQN